MKIAILGGGFTSLAAALRLSQKGFDVTIFEKEESLGGLAVGFTQKNWNWTIEKAYHHWFTNDDNILNLAKELNFPVITKNPKTSIFISGQILPFDNPISILKFPYLKFLDRLRLGFWTAVLKLTQNYQKFEGQSALSWIRKKMGRETSSKIWEPLFEGKFSDFKEQIALTWFWARIKKRTSRLSYPAGGFKMFAQKLEDEIRKNGTEIFLNISVTSLKSSGKNCQIIVNNKTHSFDKVIVTLPSPVFTKISQDLPENYIKKINSIPHLTAQVLILISKEPFLKSSYWLNITDRSFPFLVLTQHTNFMESKNYGGNHILYIGNYLKPNHQFLSLTKNQLLKKFTPYLKKINPNFEKNLINSFLFNGPFAQPVVKVDYPKLIPDFKTPLQNVYLANMDMVYPWDRGTNYAVKLGEDIASLIENEKNN